MPTTRALTVEDFRRVPRGVTSMDRWRAVPPLDSPVGRVDVVSKQSPDNAFATDSRQTPDTERIAVANALADFLATNVAAVSAAAHADYLSACWDEGWMEECGFPIDMADSEVWRYLEDLTIAVERGTEGELSGVISVNPR